MHARSPDDVDACAVLDALMPAIARGPLLYVGRPRPERLRALRDRGFAVEVADFSPDGVVQCRAQLASEGLDIAVCQLDRSSPELTAAHYALVVLDGVLSRLVPGEAERWIGAVRRATRPLGVVCATVLSTDDPALGRERGARARLARHTFRGADGRTVRGYAPGELSMAFADWLVLYAVEKVAPAPLDHGRRRVCAVVAARRPADGTILA